MTSVTFNNKVYTLREGESALDALIRGGADVEFSCKRGSCQVCLLRVASGDPGAASRKGLREELKRTGHFMPCVCHPEQSLDLEPADRSELFIEAVVSEKEALSSRVMALRLEPAYDLGWAPGQYINLRREDGVLRSYSITSVKDEDYFLTIHVTRVEGGAMSGWVHDALEVGAFVELQGPLGVFTYDEACPTEGDRDRALFLIGAGSGGGALRGVAREALRRGHRGPIHLYHGARSAADLYLHEALTQLAAAHPQLSYTPCVASGPAPAGGRVGYANKHAFVDHPDAAGAVVMLCGHPDMVHDARVDAVGAGVARADIHADPYVDARPYMPRDREKMEAAGPFPELWSALGEGPLLREILEDFYPRVYADPKLSPFFHGTTMSRAISKQYEFLSSIFSGGRYYFGLRPFNAHHWMVISDELFDYREALFDECVRRHEVPERLHRRWRAFQEMFRRDIVKSAIRGLVMDGVEHRQDGFSVEMLLVASMCDGCAAEMAVGEPGRMHRRTGKLYCIDCSVEVFEGST